MNEYEDRFED